jgi:hypothetical protein
VWPPHPPGIIPSDCRTDRCSAASAGTTPIARSSGRALWLARTIPKHRSIDSLKRLDQARRTIPARRLRCLPRGRRRRWSALPNGQVHEQAHRLDEGSGSHPVPDISYPQAWYRRLEKKRSIPLHHVPRLDGRRNRESAREAMGDVMRSKTDKADPHRWHERHWRATEQAPMIPSVLG